MTCLQTLAASDPCLTSGYCNFCAFVRRPRSLGARNGPIRLTSTTGGRFLLLSSCLCAPHFNNVIQVKRAACIRFPHHLEGMRRGARKHNLLVARENVVFAGPASSSHLAVLCYLRTAHPFHCTCVSCGCAKASRARGQPLVSLRCEIVRSRRRSHLQA